jgi:sugar phosphate isomerase/epimerase
VTEPVANPARGRGSTVVVPDAPVALSSASVYPESTASAFELAVRLGYDAIEIMVGLDPVSQDVDAIRHLVDYHQLPVCAVHAPCLLITQRVWGTEPWAKLDKSAEMANALGAGVVVVHPPFRWQRDYAKNFAEGLDQLEHETGLDFAVENMYPWRAAGRDLKPYFPDWNPVDGPYPHVTLDLSHASTAGADSLEMALALGRRLTHVHMTDGSGSARDEHLVPGRGNQRADELLEHLARQEFAGSIVLEINTRRAGSRAAREADLAESLAFTRLCLAAANEPSYSVDSLGSIEQIRRGR